MAPFFIMLEPWQRAPNGKTAHMYKYERGAPSCETPLPPNILFVATLIFGFVSPSANIIERTNNNFENHTLFLGIAKYCQS